VGVHQRIMLLGVMGELEVRVPVRDRLTGYREVSDEGKEQPR